MSNLNGYYESVISTGKVINEITRSNPDIINDSLRFGGLLKDIFGTEKKWEVFLLTFSLRLKIAEQFDLYTRNHDSLQFTIDTIINKLINELGLEKVISIWVTLTWALGLGLLSEKDLTESFSDKYPLARTIHLSDYINYLKDLQFQDGNPSKHKKSNTDQSINNPIMWNKEGLALHNQGKYQEAIECYEKGLLIDSRNCILISNKGLALHNQGKYQEAIECYEKGLLIDPQNENIQRRKKIALDIERRNKKTEKEFSYSRCNNKIYKTRNMTTRKLRNPLVIGVSVSIISIFLGVGLLVTIPNDYLFRNFYVESSDNEFNPSLTESYLQRPNMNSPNYYGEKSSVSSFTEEIEGKLFYTGEDVVGKFSENISDFSNKELLNNNDDFIIDNTVKGDMEVNSQINEFRNELEEAMMTNFN